MVLRPAARDSETAESHRGGDEEVEVGSEETLTLRI